MLLRGNGAILSQYEPVEGRPSSYQYQFRNRPDEAQCENVMSGNFTSGIVTITPDPAQDKDIRGRASSYNRDLADLTQRLHSPQHAINQLTQNAMQMHSGRPLYTANSQRLFSG